jgi:hypothetical protein
MTGKTNGCQQAEPLCDKLLVIKASFEVFTSVAVYIIFLNVSARHLMERYQYFG